MSTDNSTAKPNIAICGCCRDCATPLPLVLNELSKIGSLANHLRWVFCENDSTDQSKYILGEFKKSHENVTLHFQDGLVARIPLRTERLALMRNLYLHSLRQDDSGIDWDILIVADLDNVNKSPISIEAVRQSIELVCEGKYAALFANSKPTYYDVWALRHPQWCPNDCWSEVRQSTDLDRNSAINKFVRSRQIEINTDREFIEVDSAFGGLGIYKMSLALQSMYIGLDEEGNEKCEHVEFNKRIKSLSGQALAINPRLVNVSSLEHIARNTRFIPFKYRDDSILLECTIDHRLDSYMAGNPLYDRRLPLLALILHELRRLWKTQAICGTMAA